jgi:TetR/AcrR family acrAB operon transcriptional repressor
MNSNAARAPAQDSRDEILKAAITLFESRGFHETSMSEVAREAKVSKALIFWHFKTKEDLFLAVLSRLLEPYYIDFADEVVGLDERGQLEKLIELYLLFVRDNAGSVKFFLMRLLHSEDEQVSDDFTGKIRALYEGYRSLLIDLIRRVQEKDRSAVNLAPEAACTFLLSVLNGFLVDLLFMRTAQLDLPDALDLLRAILFRPDGNEMPRAADAGSAGVIKENP